MHITVEMPGVQACDATSCAYNVNQNCSARAITIGEGLHAACDTFFVAPRHANGNAHHAGVGACKVSGCRHNADFECSAEAIHVGVHGSHADCTTYAPR